MKIIDGRIYKITRNVIWYLLSFFFVTDMKTGITIAVGKKSNSPVDDDDGHRCPKSLCFSELFRLLGAANVVYTAAFINYSYSFL